MLVHVTRFITIQRQLVDAIGDEVDRLRRRLRFGDGDGPRPVDELERLGREDFEPTSADPAPATRRAGCDVREHEVDVIPAIRVNRR